MHRTTTTAALLVTVAVSALTGCVTVQRPPASGPPPSPTLPSAPPRRQHGPPRRPAPAREALEMVRPSEPPSPFRTGPNRSAPPAPGIAPPAPRPHPPADPQPRRTGQRVRCSCRRPSPGAPENADVCALGRRYGGWRPDSPEARICRSAYGR
ncbi:hypothetical protein E4K10_07195 [Streptomyces sp. T1317-0309]|nr:hypothetical protein E4K10_07195 [Streptomyces sp. T1317-0309]